MTFTQFLSTKDSPYSIEQLHEYAEQYAKHQALEFAELILKNKWDSSHGLKYDWWKVDKVKYKHGTNEMVNIGTYVHHATTDQLYAILKEGKQW